MGCQNTKSGDRPNGVLENGEADENQQPSVAELQPAEVSERQKELILETWQHLVDNISNVGVITFMSLFETHPDVQDVFMPFKGLSSEQLRHSSELRAHGLRVMGFVQKVVGRLEKQQPEKAECLLRELGKNHVMYGARADYVDLIGPQFVFAVKPSLTAHWSEEIEEAWLQLFRYMAYVMKSAMLEGDNSKEPSKKDGAES